MVQQKMKILFSFILFHVIYNLYVTFFCETQHEVYLTKFGKSMIM